MKAFVLAILAAHSIQSFAWLSETTDGKWRSGFGQGTAEAEVTHSSGNKIYVACNSNSAIHFTLAGDGPQPNSEVVLIFDGQKPIGVPVNKFGDLASSSRAEASVFEYVITRFKRHKTILVRFSDGRESTFTLKGASEAISDCPSGFSQ